MTRPEYPLIEWGGGCNLCGHEPWNEGDDHDPGCEGGQMTAEIIRLRTTLEDVRALLVDWWKDEQCCDSDWCAAGGTDHRLGRALAHLAVIAHDDAR